MKPGQPDTMAPMLDVNGPGHIDALGRVGFAKELLEVVRVLDAKSGGVVVGLEGEWGSGKTWVLEHLEGLNEGLDVSEQVLLVRFNPWMVSGSAEIVETFLIQLASELGTTDRRSSLQKGAQIASTLIEFTGVLSSVKHLSPMANLLLPGSGLLLDGVAYAAERASTAAKDMAGSTLDHLKKAPGRLSLNAAREKVRTLLKAAERKVAVLVDDLDRLPPMELAAMVQAVKAVADFPNVIYVLAYAPETAAHALEAALRLRKHEGRRYLEKIVQFPMPVPEVPAFKIQNFAEHRLRQALGEVAAEDQADLDEALRRAVALMRLPRDVLRMSTLFRLSVGRLKDEISPADLLLAGALNLKFPHVIEYVTQHQGEMLRPSNQVPGPRPRSKWELHRQAIEGPVADLRLKEAVRKAVSYLFDEVPEDMRFNEPHHASRRRIQKVRNWNRWRAVVRHEEVFENSEISEWLRQPHKVKESRAWSGFEWFTSFCALASDLAHETNGTDAVAFVELFAEAVRRFGEEMLMYRPDLNRVESQQALVEVIRADRVHALQAIEKLIDTCSVWHSVHLVWVVCAETLGSRGQSPAPGPRPLVVDVHAAGELVRRWQNSACDWLRAASEPHPDQAAFTLACWMFQMGADADPLRNELTRIATVLEHGLEVCFGGAAHTDAPQGDLVDLLPAPGILKPLLDGQPDFCKKHQWLVSRSSDSPSSPALNALAPAPSP